MKSVDVNTDMGTATMTIEPGTFDNKACSAAIKETGFGYGGRIDE